MADIFYIVLYIDKKAHYFISLITVAFITNENAYDNYYYYVINILLLLCHYYVFNYYYIIIIIIIIIITTTIIIIIIKSPEDKNDAGVNVVTYNVHLWHTSIS